MSRSAADKPLAAKLAISAALGRVGYDEKKIIPGPIVKKECADWNSTMPWGSWIQGHSYHCCCLIKSVARSPLGEKCPLCQRGISEGDLARL